MGELVSSADQETSIKKLKISERLESFPFHVFDHTETLEHLDLSGTGLSSLPDAFGQLKKLKIAFFSNCRFKVFPKQLAACPELEMVAFRSNGMREIPEETLPLRLRWLILTSNRIERLPKSIGKCSRLQKCMLSGNQLQSIPDEMSSCQNLGLLRLSANRLQALPEWLFNMPELAFLSFAGNPCASEAARDYGAASTLPSVPWADIEVQELLGEGASGIISRGQWRTADEVRQVAIKIFKGDVTSDGTPLDEMRACIAAGSHHSLIDPLGEIHGHPDKRGLIMQLIPTSYATLGLPPSLDSCTRDCFQPGTRLTPIQGLKILHCVASAAAQLHARGIAHGDLYAHNILYDEQGNALLGDFGAASIYTYFGAPNGLEQLEVLAFGHLLADVMSLIENSPVGSGNDIRDVPADLVKQQLESIHKHCTTPVVSKRWRFADLASCVNGLLNTYQCH